MRVMGKGPLQRPVLDLHLRLHLPHLYSCIIKICPQTDRHTNTWLTAGIAGTTFSHNDTQARTHKVKTPTGQMLLRRLVIKNVPPTYLPIIAGVYCSGGGGVAGTGVGFFSACLLGLNNGFNHFSLDCLSAIVMHRLYRQRKHLILWKHRPQIYVRQHFKVSSGQTPPSTATKSHQDIRREASYHCYTPHLLVCLFAPRLERASLCQLF